MGSTRKGRDIDAALRKKGFHRDVSGDHIVFYYDNTRISTKMSHGIMGRSLSSKLIGDMARQLHLSTRQFLALIDCPLNETGYRAILQELGIL
jgi:hypothetical protein